MIYNHKSNDIVQDVIVECLCPIIEDLADEFDMLRRCESLAIYTPSSIAREILGRILEKFDDVWVNEESHNELLYKDNNKVIITLCDDGMIFVESAYDTYGDIKRAEAVLNYVYDEFTNKEVEDIAVGTFSILVFGFEENEIEDVDIATTKEETKPTTTSKESYSINGQPVSKKEFLKVEDEFNKELRDSLLSWSKIMNNMNEMRKMFRW